MQSEDIIATTVYFGIFIFSAFHSGCKKDTDEKCFDASNPKCENYDPCIKARAVTADFFTYESGASYDEQWINYDTDTLVPPNGLFTAHTNNAEYTWLIGDEVLHERTVRRSDFPYYQRIPITLIVDKQANKQCFPNDDGKDTITRYIYFVNASETILPIEGTFIGSNIDESEIEFEVTINLRDTSASEVGNKLFTIEGLPYNCGKVKYNLQNPAIGYRQVVFDISNGKNCNYPVGIARVKNNELEINYSVTTNDNSYFEDRVEKTFRGIRK